MTMTTTNSTTLASMIIKAEESGNPEDQNDVGFHYDVEMKDRPNAIIWLRKAADQGFTLAEHNLACKLYEEDELSEGQKWFEKAAAKNYPASLYYLGVILERQGNVGGAITNYKKAARMGHQKARQALREMAIRGCFLENQN